MTLADHVRPYTDSIGRRGHRRRDARAGATFVGRTRELDELGAAFADANDGHGAVFLVCGEPGIGKSRLMEVLAASGGRMDGPCWSAAVGTAAAGAVGR